MPPASDDDRPATRDPGTSAGYVLFQLARALGTAESHTDAATRERANERIARWVAVWNGMLSGKLSIGSRTPVAATPAWATLEVITGGFATGRLLAGGPLSPSESARLADIAPAADRENRQALNSYWITEVGLRELTELLHSGLYTVDLPEEGALLVVAWLVQNGHADAARSLLDELGPYFPRLRFYPSVSAHPRPNGAEVFLQDVGAAITSLRRIEPNAHLLAQKESIDIWQPLYDQTAALFLETVDGEPPRLQPPSDEAPTTSEPAITGGWPCRRYPRDWTARARAVLTTYDRERSAHALCGKPERRKENFTQLRAYLKRCVEAPDNLTPRDMSRIRTLLARYVTTHGSPGSAMHEAKRRAQRKQAGTPCHAALAGVLVDRLAALPQDRGIDDLESVAQPVSNEERSKAQVPAGTHLPECLVRKMRRSMSDTIDALVHEDVITSGEVLARVLPQISSTVRAAGFADPALSRLYSAIYRAFRRRRSLLLLDLSSQVRLEELPWIAAIERFRRSDLSSQQVSRQTLEQMVALTVTSFPYAIIPNKLLQELRALAKGADLDLPLVDELAADIFMGRFGPKFVAAAKRAATLLKGSLYARYYAVDYAEILDLSDSEKSWLPLRFGRQPSTDAFATLCARRAGVELGGWDTAKNGMVIEQQQILTTQNLAVLFLALGLNKSLTNCLEDLARQCLLRICAHTQMKVSQRHARLIRVKNTAYAWRQMVFFLSLLPESSIQSFLTYARSEFGARADTQLKPLQVAFRGLETAASGQVFAESAEARRFLGWSQQKHWMLQGDR